MRATVPTINVNDVVQMCNVKDMISKTIFNDVLQYTRGNVRRRVAIVDGSRDGHSQPYDNKKEFVW